MRIATLLTLGTLAFGAALADPAAAAGICKAEKLSCATQMPVGGYCECTARGVTESGTVMERSAPARRAPANSTAGGCGANPNAPGCR